MWVCGLVRVLYPRVVWGPRQMYRRSSNPIISVNRLMWDRGEADSSTFSMVRSELPALSRLHFTPPYVHTYVGIR